MLDRTVRVFISSTFRDFGEERDLLMKRVFPELRRRARDRFVQVIGVDLRWGVTEADSQQGETLPICLREIERSRPYFIGLLGERYGWTPSAGQYPELLLAQQPWLAAHAGGTSVTELEVLHGVLNNPEMAGRAFFYFRDASWSDAKGPEFRSEGAEDQAKLARLKDGIRASVFPVVEYSTPEAVADRITDDLWALIDQQYPEDAVPDELERERRSHEAYAAERRRLYVGQDETVARLLARLEDASDEPGEDGARTRITLITGESGTGKSALLANTLNAYRAAHPNDVVIEHYVGSTSDASDPVKLMRRVAEEIKRLTGSITDIETDEEKLVEQFATCLADASYWAKRQGVRFVLALDALDKLESRSNLRWLPRNVLPHVRVVASSLQGEARDALVNRGALELEAALFSADIARRYVTETLAHRGRKLPAYELDRIIAHPKSTLPLFLKTLVEELSVFGSYEGLPARISECLAAQEPDDLFEIIFARLEDDFGRDVVQKPLQAIAASFDGMSDDELLRFTGLAPLALARLKLALDDTLYEAGGLIRMSHAYAQKGVQDRYMPTDEARRSIHRELGLWWEVQELGARMAWEMDYQLFQAKAWDDLCRCLVAPRTGMAAVRHLSFESWFASWRSIAASRGDDNVTSRISDELGGTWQQWQAGLDETRESLWALQWLSTFLLQSNCFGQYTLAVCSETLAVARRVAAKNGTHDGYGDVSFSLDQVGGIQEARGDLAGALSNYEESLAIRRSLAVEARTPKARRDVSRSLTRVGGIEEKRGDRDGALTRYKECLAISRALEAALGTPESRSDLSASLIQIASIEEARGDLDAALVRYKEGLEIYRALVDEFGTPKRRRHVLIPLNRIAGIERVRGDLSGALLHYEEGLKIAYTLMAELGTPESRRDVSVVISRIAGIEHVRGELSSALTRYEDALELARALMSELGTPQSRSDVSAALRQVGGIEQTRGNLSNALARYEESLGIYRALMAEARTLEIRRGVSSSLGAVAGIEQARGNLSVALARYEESLGIYRALMAELGTPESRRDVSIGISRIAGIEHIRGELSSALTRYEDALELERALMSELGTPQSRCDVSFTLDRIGDIEQARGDHVSALVRYDEGLRIRRALMAELATPNSRRDVSISLIHVADCELACGNVQIALSRYEEGLAIFRDLMSRLGTPDSRRNMGVALNRIAGINQFRGDVSGALDRYEEVLEITRALMAEINTLESRGDVSFTLARIADIEQARGDHLRALGCFEEALEIAHALMSELGTTDARRSFLWTVQKTATCLLALNRPTAAYDLLQSSEASAIALESDVCDDGNVLDTVAAYWERRAEAAAHSDPQEASTCTARATSIRTRIADINAE
jgi:tetratricopeptide (TPR) repeat protein